MDLVGIRALMRARWAPRSERGANLVEYLLLVSLIAIAVMGAVAYLGGGVSSLFNSAGSQVSQAP